MLIRNGPSPLTAKLYGLRLREKRSTTLRIHGEANNTTGNITSPDAAQDRNQ